jgi:hypothetical protein
MSDRCLGWRMLLSRRSDGDLSHYEWEALEDHMAGCRECQEAAKSDRVLHLALTRQDFALDTESSHRLDDHILLALGLPERLSLGQRCLRRMRELWATWEALPNLYLTQIVGGTLVASALTAVFLLTALHPVEDTARTAGEVHRVSAARSNEPPVPLESLLDRPSPRAAFLWTIPALPRPHRSPMPALPDAAPPPASKAQPSGMPPAQQHGSLPDTFVRG